jgi:hypothetical protein
MKGSCRICIHPEVGQINLALVHGGSVRVTAKQFNLGDWSAVARHKRNHLPKFIA